LLSNLFDFNPAEDIVTYDQLPESDRYILHRLAEVIKDVTEAYDNFQFSRFFQTIQNFCTVDLSNFYLDIAKDRLYISAPNAPRRRSCQTVLMYCLEAITKAIAPVLAHTAEDIWQYLPYPVPYKSVFQAGWFTAHDKWYKPELATKWEYLREVRSEVNKVLETARTGKLIGAPLEAKVLLSVSDAVQKDYLASLGEELRYLFIVSQAEIVDSLPAADFTGEANNLKIAVVKADGEKCPRCWNYSTHIGESAEHPHICDRCVGALAGTF
jgi:isoleucyl-tRNA synthetase